MHEVDGADGRDVDPSPMSSQSEESSAESTIMRMLRQHERDSKVKPAGYYLFSRLYPLLTEMGWRKMEDMQGQSVYVTHWAMSYLESSGRLLSRGRCDVDGTGELVLNRDYFVNTKRLVSYISKHGCHRSDESPSPATVETVIGRSRVRATMFR